MEAIKTIIRKTSGGFWRRFDGVESYVNFGSVWISGEFISAQFCAEPMVCEAGPFWITELTLTDHHGRVFEYTVAALKTESHALRLCTRLNAELLRGERLIDVDDQIEDGSCHSEGVI